MAAGDLRCGPRASEIPMVANTSPSPQVNAALNEILRSAGLPTTKPPLKPSEHTPILKKLYEAWRSAPSDESYKVLKDAASKRIDDLAWKFVTMMYRGDEKPEMLAEVRRRSKGELDKTLRRYDPTHRRHAALHTFLWKMIKRNFLDVLRRVDSAHRNGLPFGKERLEKVITKAVRKKAITRQEATLFRRSEGLGGFGVTSQVQLAKELGKHQSSISRMLKQIRLKSI
jgi:hypothetical protein